MKDIVFQIDEAAEGGWGARSIGESIFTQADTRESLRENVRDAVRCHFEEDTAPKVIRLHFVHDEIISA